MTIKLPYFLPRRLPLSISDDAPIIQKNNKRQSDGVGDRNPKRQRRGEESSTAARHPPALSQADAFCASAPQRPTSEVTPNSPRTDTASTSTNKIKQIPAANAGGMSAPTCQPSKVVVPCKRPYPCEKDVLTSRKKRKTGSSVVVRIYEQRKDLEHTDEVECALTSDGGLDLVGLSQRLNGKGLQVSRFIILSMCGLSRTTNRVLLKVLDAHSSRPWFSKRPFLESGAIKLLKAKEGYLRAVVFHDPQRR